MKVAVGSTNPTKVAAVQHVFSTIYKEEITVIAKDVTTGVREQPMSEEKTIEGAINRAKRCLAGEKFGVGIEGGIHSTPRGYFLRAWVAIWDGDTLGLGGCASLQLPSFLVETMLDENKTLGEVMNILTGRSDVHKKEGAFGVFTTNRLPRRESFYHGIIVALSPFLHAELHDVKTLKTRLKSSQ